MYYTREQILNHILELRPLTALTLKNGNRLQAVRTQIYDGVIVNGEEILLQRGPNNTYVAGYCRVSMPIQVEDGFSDKEQAEAIVDRCIANGQAFAIFSDVSLSGGLPYENDDLIRQFRDHKALMYETVFRAVFLSKPEQETAENLARMEAYLKKHLKKIRNGGYSEIFDLMRGEKPPHSKDRKPRWFRPGLTALVQTLDNIHTILVTDLSRLSRSELLMADLLPRFRERKIAVQGIYQGLDWLNKHDDLSSKILSIVYTHMAEKTRFDILLGDLRGIRQRLVQGIYHAKGTDWIKRENGDKNGKGVFDERQKQVALRLIELYLGDNGEDEASATFVTNTLNAEGLTNKFGRRWNDNTVCWALDNPALIGFQEIFGKWWKVYPPVIDEETWAKVREKRARRRADHDRRQATKTVDEYLMTGLLKCHCGYNLVAAKSNNKAYYACNAPISRGHARLVRTDVDAFFDLLMANHSEKMIDVVVANSDGAGLMAELRTLEENALVNATTREEERVRRKRELEPVVADLLPQHKEDPMFEATLQSLLAARTRDLDEAEKSEQERITSTRGRLIDIRHQEEFAEIKATVKHWRELSVPMRNKILKDVFAYLQVQGTPPNETLLPVFRVPSPPLIIPIKVIGTLYNTKVWVRSLQNPLAWVYDMLSKERVEENDTTAQVVPWDDEDTPE